MRDGRPLGDTQFRNMHAAYEDLPADIKTRLEGRTATHDFAKFWDMMRARPGSQRAAADAGAARQEAAGVAADLPHPPDHRPHHSLLQPGLCHAHRRHAGSRERPSCCDYLFKHQEQEKYFHAHKWAEGDVLMWDNIGTVHNAVPDYGPNEPRYMRRVQVMATKDYARLAA